MSDLSLPPFSPSLVPLALAPDAVADAAVMAADAVDFVTRDDAGGEGDDGDLPESGLAARITPEDGLAARETTLEQALDAVVLEGMTEREVAELESGDAARMAAVLKVKEPGAAEPKAETGRPAGAGPEDGSGLNRVSIKALPPALRLKLVTAISRVRDGGDFEQALREVFPGVGASELDGGWGRTEGGTPQAAGRPEAYPTAAGRPEAYPTAAGRPEAYPTDAGRPGAYPTDAGRPEARPTEMPEVAGLQARLAGMKAEYDRAKAEYDPRAQDLLEAMMDVKLDLREARQAQAGLLQQQRASHERAMAEHADLMGDAESPFLDLCEMTISLAQRNNDPILTEPDWPERIAKQVRGKFFKGGAASSGAARVGGRPQSSSPVPPAPQQRVRLPGSPVGNGFAPGAVTPETALAEFDQLTPEEQEAALTEIARVTDGRRRR